MANNKLIDLNALAEFKSNCDKTYAEKEIYYESIDLITSTFNSNGVIDPYASNIRLIVSAYADLDKFNGIRLEYTGGQKQVSVSFYSSLDSNRIGYMSYTDINSGENLILDNIPEGSKYFRFSIKNKDGANISTTDITSSYLVGNTSRVAQLSYEKSNDTKIFYSDVNNNIFVDVREDVEQGGISGSGENTAVGNQYYFYRVRTKDFYSTNYSSFRIYAIKSSMFNIHYFANYGDTSAISTVGFVNVVNGSIINLKIPATAKYFRLSFMAQNGSYITKNDITRIELLDPLVNASVLDNIDFNDAQFNALLSNNECNLFNPLTAKNNIGLTTAAGAETGNTDAYSSDFIDIEGAKYIMCSHRVSKLCLYDSSYNFVITKEPNNDVNFNLSENTGFKYCKVMINKTYLSYENRFLFSLALSQYFDYPYSYKHVAFNGIGNNEINIRKLDKGLKQGIVAENIKLNNNPLSYKDFQLGNLITSTGEFGSNVNVIVCRDLLFLPKGTKISFTSAYSSTIYEYNKEDTTFFGRYKGTGWFNPMIVPNDGYYRIIVHKNDATTIAQSEIKTIIDNMSMEYNYSQNELKYSGEHIEIKTNKLSYVEQGFSGNGQDSAQYGGKVFSFNSSGQFKVYDFTTKQEFTGFQLDQYSTIKPHCNCVCFSNQFYSSSDEFPLLYVNAYNTEGLPKGTCYVHRIIRTGNTYTTTLIQTISIGFTTDEMWTVEGDTRDYGNFLVDTDKNQLIVYTLRNNKTRFFIFNLPSISSSQVTLQTTDILDYFDCDFFNYIQGGYYNDGKVYSLDGIGTQSNPIGYLHVFDLEKKELVTSVDISSLMYEPESIFEYQGNLFVGQSTFYELVFK